MDQLRFQGDWLACERGEAEAEWERIRQWLGMLAGLRYVDVVPWDNRYWGLCERAEAYDDEKNDIVTDMATEETRLLYAWGAIERLMKALKLPPVPDKRADKPYNRASLVITKAFPPERALPHYSHVLRHLKDHVARDYGLAADRALRRAGEERPWRSENAQLLSLGKAMRNIPAHGESAYPEPTDWNESNGPRRRRLHPAAHAPRLATRGLLLSLQQLLAATTEMAPGAEFEAEEFGWWVQSTDGSWRRVEEPRLTDLLRSAHLQPPDDDD